MIDKLNQGPVPDESRIERNPARGYENRPADADKKKASPPWPNTASRVAGILGRK